MGSRGRAKKSPGGWPLVFAITAAVVTSLWLALVGWLYASQRELMYYPAPWQVAPSTNGPPIQVVQLDTSDGERLVAWYLPPQEGKPVILYFGGNGDALSLQEGRWSRIADAGVGVLAVAYRGYSGSTGHPTEKGLHEDARTGYRWLAARHPPGQIVIHGFSLGTGVAVRLAAEQPSRALILEAPFTAAVDIIGARAPYVPSGLLMHDRYLSRKWIGKVHVPVLVIHGDRDSIIPFASGQKLYALANQPKQFVRMAGSDHANLVVDGLYPHVWRFLGVEYDPRPELIVTVLEEAVSE